MAFFRFGEERYEKEEMQKRVRELFVELEESDTVTPWKRINAAQTVEDVESDIWKAVEECLESVKEGRPLYKLWQEGSCDLSVYDQN